MLIGAVGNRAYKDILKLVQGNRYTLFKIGNIYYLGWACREFSFC